MSIVISGHTELSNAPMVVGGYPFEIVIDTTTIAPTSSFQFQLPNISTDFRIDWGDGNIEQIFGSGQEVHAYNTPGIYTIKAYGVWPMQALADGVLEVKSFGQAQPYSTTPGIFNISTLNKISAPDILDLSNSTSFSEWFYDISTYTEIPNIGKWDTSTITNMYRAFRNNDALTDIDLSNWDTSNVTTMQQMFYVSSLMNPKVDGWDTSNVENMSYLFNGTSFTNPVNSFNTSKVINMQGMFSNLSNFNHPLSHFDTSLVTICSQMFQNCSTFDQPIGNWNVGSCYTMVDMFNGCTNFDQPIGDWDVSNVLTFNEFMFNAANFNRPIGDWNVSSSTDFFRILRGCNSFDQDLSNWVYSGSGVASVAANQSFMQCSVLNSPVPVVNNSVNDISYMFGICSIFNQPLTGWDTSQVTNMNNFIYQGAQFDQDVSHFDTSKVTEMKYMFQLCTNFNNSGSSGIGSWDTGQVTTFQQMFETCPAFNQPIETWNVTSATASNAFYRMFYRATSFSQSLAGWDMSNATSTVGLNNFMNQPWPTANYEATLISWASQSLNSGITINFGTATYTSGSAADASRQVLIDTYGWTVNDGGYA